MSNVQFDYSTLSTSITPSELGTIIGRHVPEDSYDTEEIDSENVSTSQVFNVPSPIDKYHLVYLTFGLLGIGTLLPWNFFITANDYWMYKFRNTLNQSCHESHFNKSDLQAAFTSYLSIANNVPYVSFLIFSSIFINKFSKVFHIIGSLIIMFLLFAIVTAFVQVDTDEWQIGYFALIMILVIAVSITSALLQTNVTGLVSLFPSKYMHIMVLGQAFAGILASVVQILSLLEKCDSLKSALIYFFSADTVILITLLSYLSIRKSAFFRYHSAHLKAAALLKCLSESQVRINVSLVSIIKLIWPFALSILINFWVTIGIFPGLAVLVESKSPGNLWNGKLYLVLACFLLFNISDFCGRLVGGYLPLPLVWRLRLLYLCSLRIGLIPLFMLCNANPRSHLPVIFNSDAYYISFITILGFSNGYFVAIAMANGIKFVNPFFQEMAGVLLSAFLGVGLMLGSFTSYLFIKLI